MNIIFDNIIFAIQRSGGGSVYWYELISRFARTHQNIFFLEQGKTSNIFRKSLKLESCELDRAFPLRINMYLPVYRTVNKKTIFHSSYYRFSLSKNIVNVTTIHDFTAEYYFKGLSRFVNYHQKRIALKNSHGIICISENTKRDLLKFHPKLKNKEIKVIYNGVSDSFYKIENIEEEILKLDDLGIKECLKTKYILYVGHRTTYKNFDLAVKTLAEFNGQLHFVIVGEKLKSEEQKFINNYLSDSQYTVLSGKNNEQLNLLYNNAFCLIYPSSYEGFGIPILEAMKTGCPVITTNKSSIPEVAGDAAIMVNDLSVKAFGTAINSLFDLGIRNTYINKGYKQAEKFSWDKTFNEVVQFYQSLYDKG